MNWPGVVKGTNIVDFIKGEKSKSICYTRILVTISVIIYDLPHIGLFSLYYSISKEQIYVLFLN
jgi:hypothetical protein